MSWSQLPYFYNKPVPSGDFGSPPPIGAIIHFAVSKNFQFSIMKRKTDSCFVVSMFYNFLLEIYFNKGKFEQSFKEMIIKKITSKKDF
jgi:hypothetical protein